MEVTDNEADASGDRGGNCGKRARWRCNHFRKADRAAQCGEHVGLARRLAGNGTFIKVDPVPFGLAVGWDYFDDPHVRDLDEQ